MKILMSQFGNETNSFSIGRTTWETLVPNGWVKAVGAGTTIIEARCPEMKGLPESEGAVWI